jgi:DNA-binding PadR family transcriptional regulator
VRQEVLLAMLAKEPSHGYELRAGLDRALGPLAKGINEGQEAYSKAPVRVRA